jgi:hypothetical protein
VPPAHSLTTFIYPPNACESMSNTLNCPECGTDIDSTDDLEAADEVTEIEPDEDGSFQLYENHDLFLCKSCRKPLGVSRS